ncbi:MAG TPA: DEAD/DEAH box helicase, partial [Ornithinibacter sp.]|nr:DEAD/DEAH box helicase [Ornithinibacter sp.]
MSSPAQHLAVLSAGSRGERLLHVERVPARSARLAPWPEHVAPAVMSALVGAGIEQPWSHQRTAIDLAHAGQHVVLATGTASGKSLGYLVPVLGAASEGAATPGGRGATAIYLAPTKALAADQLARIEALAVPGVRAATYDGDTPPDERRWIREHANV